jgi:hypothetical protein
MAQLALTFLTLHRARRNLPQVYVLNLWVQLVHSKSLVPYISKNRYLNLQIIEDQVVVPKHDNGPEIAQIHNESEEQEHLDKLWFVFLVFDYITSFLDLPITIDNRCNDCNKVGADIRIIVPNGSRVAIIVAIDSLSMLQS